MSMTTGITASFAAAALAATLAVAAPQAQANDNLSVGDVGWCGTPAEFSAYAQAEGQRAVFVGNVQLHVRGSDGLLHHIDRYVGKLVTMSYDGRSGHVLTTDQPMDGSEAFSEVCFDASLESVRLYDVRETQILASDYSAGTGGRPEYMYNERSRSAAEARCDQAFEDGEISVRGACQFLNDDLVGGATNNISVVLQAAGASKNDSGEWRRNGTVVTVVLDRDDAKSFVLYSGGSGATVVGDTLERAGYTKHGLAKLREGIPVSVAAASPRQVAAAPARQPQ